MKTRLDTTTSDATTTLVEMTISLPVSCGQNPASFGHSHLLFPQKKRRNLPNLTMRHRAPGKQSKAVLEVWWFLTSVFIVPPAKQTSRGGFLLF